MTFLPSRTRGAIAVALASAALLAGCSKPTEAELEDRGHDAIEAVGIEIKAHWSEADKVKHKTAPEFTHLESHVFTWQDGVLHEQAYFKIVNTCLARAGHKSRLSLGKMPAKADSHGTFYGQPSLVFRNTGGFPPHKPWMTDTDHVPWLIDGASAKSDRYPKLWELAGGRSPDGCFMKEHTAMRKGLGATAHLDEVQTASDAALEKMRASHEVAAKDSAVIAAAARWRTCMEKVGQPSSGPQVYTNATAEKIQKQREDKPRDPKEVAADVACRSATGYLDAYVEVLNREHSKFLLESADLMKHSSPESRQKRRKALKAFLAK